LLAPPSACNIDHWPTTLAELLSAYPPGVWLALLFGPLGVGGGVVAVPVLIEIFALIGLAKPVTGL